jgi:hypothetical protein
MAQQVKKFPAFYGTRSFIFALTSAHHRLDHSGGLLVRSNTQAAKSWPIYRLDGLRLLVLFLRWAGHVARMGARRGAYRALVGKPEGRRPLGRPKRRWEDNIKMDVREVGCGAWTGSIWLRIGTGGELLRVRL